jgi:catechol 2,3-dioxygenase-like lactoylglutathione lyase family enzyme
MTTPVGPDFIALQVRDLAASRKFYIETFGFEAATHSPPGAVVFKTAPIPLALREPMRPLPEAGPLGVGMVLWVACNDAGVLHDTSSEAAPSSPPLPTAPSVASSSHRILTVTRSPFIRRVADRA